ncbi:hypothetical protein [Bacillus wiedmannii]|uniref:hypothetical protein n=1 Tax=Bacillus wiedmannii TaxID=1890302 RepID=UPI000E74CE00
MAGLAILISIASFILSKKEVSNVQTTAPHPKPITLPAPSTSTAEATPPISPNTNSVVRFFLNILRFLYFILIYAFLITNFLTFFSVHITLKLT